MVVMRAKMQISHIEIFGSGEHKTEKLYMRAVGPSGCYPDDGSDENNSYAKWTPTADLTICINNPALHGQFEPDECLYLDFSRVPKDDTES